MITGQVLGLSPANMTLPAMKYELRWTYCDACSRGHDEYFPLSNLKAQQILLGRTATLRV